MKYCLKRMRKYLCKLEGTSCTPKKELASTSHDEPILVEMKEIPNIANSQENKGVLPSGNMVTILFIADNSKYKKKHTPKNSIL